MVNPEFVSTPKQKKKKRVELPFKQLPIIDTLGLPPSSVAKFLKHDPNLYFFYFFILLYAVKVKLK